MIGVALWVVKMMFTIAKVLDKLGFIDAAELIRQAADNYQNPSTTVADDSTTLGE